jgi:hypothetical protein
MQPHLAHAITTVHLEEHWVDHHVVHQGHMVLLNHVHVLTLAHMVVLNKVDGVIQVITRVVVCVRQIRMIQRKTET